MNCAQCGVEGVFQYGSGKFCSPTCARKFSSNSSTKRERLKLGMKKGLSSIVGSPEVVDTLVEERVTRTFYGVSQRTRLKVMRRIQASLKIGCCVCGWSEGVCDLHHILPRKKGGGDTSDNLTVICPNCHRLAHMGLLDKSKIVTFETQVGEDWKNFLDLSQAKKVIRRLRGKRKLNCRLCKKPLGRTSSKSGLCMSCCQGVRWGTISIPSPEILLGEVLSENLTKVGKKYGVSATAIKKRIIKGGLSIPPWHGVKKK